MIISIVERRGDRKKPRKILEKIFKNGYSQHKEQFGTVAAIVVFFFEGFLLLSNELC